MQIRLSSGVVIVVLVALAVSLTTCRDVPTTPTTPTPVRPDAEVTSTGTQVLVGAGNIARCDGTKDEATATLLDGIAGTVFTAGDNIRASGSSSDFANCYTPSWGRHTARTRPAAGDYEYQTSGATGYFGYFGSSAGESGQGYYSYDLGDWHVVVLNSEISTAAGSAQEQWLRADLANSTKQCTIAYWHDPRFSSYGTTVRSAVKPLWDALYAAGAEIVVNAHYRLYERFAPQTPAEVADPEKGIRQFTVGTGGHGVDNFGTSTPRPNSEVRQSGTYGVLKLTLGAGTYQWEFVPIAGQTFTDAGSGDCHAETAIGSVTVSPDSPTILTDGAVQLTATPRDADGNVVSAPVAWSSSNTSVATVDGNGVVTGRSAGSATIRATSRGTVGTATVSVTNPPSGSIVLVGAGDIASCNTSMDEATAVLLDGIAGTVFTTGDNAYPNGTASEYTNCYHPTWGRHKARTRPVVGNHEYNTAGAAGYFGYFGDAAGEPGKGYYSFDAGDWHVVVLNDNVDPSATSPQVAWLRADLEANPRRCTLALWHWPRFTTVSGGTTAAHIKPFWDVIYAAGVDLVVNGHHHLYERFAPQRPDGTKDLTTGIRQITVGTGGQSLYNLGATTANLEVRNNTSRGVLKLTLHENGYYWEFIPVAGQSFRDTGSGTCHGEGTAPANQSPVARPGGPYSGDGRVRFDGTASSDPDNHTPLTYAWDFGDGASGTGATPTHTYTADGTYTVKLIVTDTKGASSAPVSTEATSANVAPTVTAGPDVTALAGATVNVSATFTDPGPDDDPWAYAVDWGDGATTTGSVTSQSASITGSHSYAAAGTYTVRISVTDKDDGAGSDELTATITAAAAAQTIAAAGNIASCNTTRDEATAALLDNIPGVVFALGDNVANGTAAEYTNCYHPSWGRHLARTYTSLGNHEYNTGTADASFDYFGERAGPRGKGFFSFDLGDWHVVVLNSNISMAAGSEQEQWLKADLAANDERCTLAVWHHNRFFSSKTAGWNSSSGPKPLWVALYAAGADLVLNGNAHFYERFAPQTPDGVRDDARGVVQINPGTGGESVETPTVIAPNSVKVGAAYGVLKLTLGPDSYTWEFVPSPGQSLSDSGSGNCH